MMSRVARKVTSDCEAIAAVVERRTNRRLKRAVEARWVLLFKVITISCSTSLHYGRLVEPSY
jgi:hypothetical protein